jgi:hypothetical protein
MDRVDVLFQITNLREPFAAMLALEGTTAVVLAEVVPDVTRLLKGHVTALEQTFVISPRFVRSFILNSYYLYFSSWYSDKLVF